MRLQGILSTFSRTNKIKDGRLIHADLALEVQNTVVSFALIISIKFNALILKKS